MQIRQCAGSVQIIMRCFTGRSVQHSKAALNLKTLQACELFYNEAPVTRLSFSV